MTRLKELGLDLSGNEAQWKQLVFLENLQKLSLWFHSSEIHEKSHKQLGKTLSALRNLEEITLNFSANCSSWSTSSLKILFEGMSRLKHLSYLNLRLKSSEVDHETARVITKSIFCLKGLNYLNIYLSYIHETGGIKEYFENEFRQLGKKVKGFAFVYSGYSRSGKG